MRRLDLVVLALLWLAVGCGKSEPLVPGDGTDGPGMSGNRDSGANDVVTLGDGAVVGPGDGGSGDGGSGDGGSGDAGCTRSGDEVCNDRDDDCDDRIDEGLPIGEACDGPDSDTCAQGLWACNDRGELRCTESTSEVSTEVCDSIDNDCDDEVDEGFDVDQACDGNDGDLCEDGVTVCNAAHDGTRCDDDAAEVLDLCNDRDDDCDPASDDGSEDDRVGNDCDGNDSDNCQEGTYACGSSGLTCSDNTGGTPDLCNGADDDCNTGTADGSGDPSIGMPCDGGDSDRCNEGTLECTASGPLCDDETDSTVDTCDGENDDCDATSTDGSEDPYLNTPCDGDDADDCEEGTYTACLGGGVLQCNDAPVDNVEICNSGDDDCDGYADEGSVADDPVCGTNTFNLGTVSGDTGAMVLTDTHFDEEWDLVRIQETSTTTTYLSATVTLQSPPGVDFDLYVYCVSCGGDLAGQSTLGTGLLDTVQIRKEDLGNATDESFDILIEVVEYLGSICAPTWTLTVTGNSSVATATCF